MLLKCMLISNFGPLRKDTASPDRATHYVYMQRISSSSTWTVEAAPSLSLDLSYSVVIQQVWILSF